MWSINSRHGGVARAVIDLCGALAVEGHAVTILTTDDEVRLGSSAEAVNLEILSRKVLRGAYCLRAGREMFRGLVRRHDVLHVHGMWEPTNIQFARIAHEVGVPYIVSLHGMLNRSSVDQKTFKKWIYMSVVGMRYLGRAAYVHVSSESELRQSARWLTISNGFVIPNAIELAQFGARTDSSCKNDLGDSENSTAFRVLFLSRLHPQKGPEILIGAMDLLRRAGKQVCLVIAGQGDAGFEAGLRETVIRLNLQSMVTFVGHVDGTEKIAMLRSVDLLALPTIEESFGYAYFEALATGTPVLTTGGIALANVLSESKAVFFAERTPQAFANKIVDMMRHRDLLREAGKVGRQWVFRWSERGQAAAEYTRMYSLAVD